MPRKKTALGNPFSDKGVIEIDMDNWHLMTNLEQLRLACDVLGSGSGVVLLKDGLKIYHTYDEIMQMLYNRERQEGKKTDSCDGFSPFRIRFSDN